MLTCIVLVSIILGICVGFLAGVYFAIMKLGSNDEEE